LASARVLLADDNSAIISFTASLLASCFEVVAAVNDGRSAVDAVRKLHPDVVVLDISMPILDGIAAARVLRKADPDAKIVFLTADGSAELQEVALETGALGYVVKARMGADLVPAISLALVGCRFISPRSE
jgi:DNA-binding NarL/FixJ family response regulator